jgi:hypothetical protein
MYTFFYIILFFIIIVIIAKKQFATTSSEHFLQNTIELSELTVDPVQFYLNTNDINQLYFFNIFKLLIPLKHNDKTFEIFIDNSILVFQDFLNTPNSNLRMVAPLYDEYLTIICDFSNHIITYENMLSDCKQQRDFFIISNRASYFQTVQFIKILFPSNRFTFYNLEKFPKKLNKFALYCKFCTENNADLQTLSKRNQYFIMEFPKNHPNYQNLNINFQNVILSKYDISMQIGSNIRRVIYSFMSSVNLYTFSSVSNIKIYNVIKALFEGLDYFRIYVNNKNVKYLFESIRPEKMIVISVIPLHPAVEHYYRELFVFTNNQDPICINNAVSALKCQPDTIFNNRFRLLNLFGTKSM